MSAIQGMNDRTTKKRMSFCGFGGITLTVCVLLFIQPRKARNTRKEMEVWQEILTLKTVPLEIRTDPESVLLCHRDGGELLTDAPGSVS
jgi:hypothetical protein